MIGDPATNGALVKFTTCAALTDIAVVPAVWMFSTPLVSAVVISPPLVAALIVDAI
jgi:hypothetical protein